MPVRLVLVMVTSNSYDLGVTANTLQDINPWPGDQIRHITPRWRSRRFRNTVFPSSVLRSLALSRESARTYRQRGLLARPFLNQSTIFVRQQRRRVASPAGRSRSPRSPLPVYRVALGATLSASSTGAARRSSLEQRAVQPILLSIFSFDGSSVAGPRVLVRAQPFNPSFSAASYGAERNPVIFIDSSC